MLGVRQHLTLLFPTAPPTQKVVYHQQDAGLFPLRSTRPAGHPRFHFRNCYEFLQRHNRRTKTQTGAGHAQPAAAALTSTIIIHEHRPTDVRSKYHLYVDTNPRPPCQPPSPILLVADDRRWQKSGHQSLNNRRMRVTRERQPKQRTIVFSDVRRPS